MTDQGTYTHFIGPFSLGEVLDPLEHTFTDQDGEPYPLDDEGFTGVLRVQAPDGTVQEVEGITVLSAGRVNASLPVLDQVGLWRAQFIVTNDYDPGHAAFRRFASVLLNFDVQPVIPEPA